MKKHTFLFALAILSFLLGCKEASVEEAKTLSVLEVQTDPAKSGEIPAVDPSNFFASRTFGAEGGGGVYNVIYPYDVPDLNALLDAIYEAEINGTSSPDFNIGAQLKKDYSKFDPLLLFENDPETLAKNFSYGDKQALTLSEIEHMQALNETLKTMLTQSERWEPGSESVTLRPPEGYPGWYGLAENGETEPIQSLLYVDWRTWQKTTKSTWKSHDESWDWEREDKTITFFDRGETSTFAYLPNESGFFLASTSSYSYFNMDGAGGGQHKVIYAYDTAGRLQESFMIVDGEAGGVIVDTRLFEFTSYVYDGQGRLTGVRSSDVVLASNQLPMPELDYEQTRYWAQAPLLP